MGKYNVEFVVYRAEEEDPKWPNYIALLFHAFNPNGLVAKKKHNDEIISGLVDDKVVPSGWLLTYGSFFNYHEDRVIELAASGKRRISGDKYRSYIGMLEDYIERQEEKIESAKRGEHNDLH